MATRGVLGLLLVAAANAGEPPAPPAESLVGSRGGAAYSPSRPADCLPTDDCPGDASGEEEEATLLQLRPAQAPWWWGAPAFDPSNAPPRNRSVVRPLSEPAGPNYTLVMQPTKLYTPWLAPGGYFWTRGYGTVPGPVLRVKPGETLRITLDNKLESPSSDCMSILPEGTFPNPFTICHLNTTNLHTHGLHTSPEDPGDNALRRVLPNATWQYEIPIPSDHMGGTHWYHPHIHHATSSQAGGGAHGIIIVEDLPGSLPPEVENMPEHVLVLSLVDVVTQMRLEQWGGGKLWTYSLNPAWRWTLLDYLWYPPKVLVNGLLEPVLELQPGAWHRLRTVFSSTEMSVTLSLQIGSLQPQCQLQLLAKDGIYLNEAPRPLTQDFNIVPGGRSDLAVACTCPTAEPCGAWLKWSAKFEPFGTTEKPWTLAEQTGQLVYLKINGAAAVPPLPKFSVKRPCYLVDLRNASVLPVNKHTVLMPTFPPLNIQFDGVAHTFHQSPVLGTFQVGQVVELAVTGSLYHPFHQHVVPYQVTSVQETEYMQVGDWHDTLRLTRGNSMTLRFQTDKFTGKYIIHCHILEHEDAGMMGYVDVQGTEGTVWPGATQLDPSCYQTADGAGYKLL